uniref:Uncharacterized protein n=1 Tax=Micrurus spixii TaxID=129469 RepID=A0A2D4MZB3_9SAUR
MFADVVKRQWVSTDSYPNSTGYDRKFYNLAQESAGSLQTPAVDEPIVTLAFPSTIPSEAEDVLKLEEKRMEFALRKVPGSLRLPPPRPSPIHPQGGFIT